MTAKDEDEFILVCPKCGSTDIRTKGRYGRYCAGCDYGNLIRMKIPFLELMASELENFRQEIKENPIVKDK